MDLGPCPRLHSDRILKQFQEHLVAHPHDPRINAFRQEHENSLYGFVEDCDRRIRASQRKLEKTPEENRKTVEMVRAVYYSFQRNGKQSRLAAWVSKGNMGRRGDWDVARETLMFEPPREWKKVTARAMSAESKSREWGT